MVFKRRRSLPLSRRIQGYFYPRTGWRRAIEYIGHRIKRLPDTPHKIAIGISCGVFISFSPLFGLHMILAVFFAFVLRGNMLAAFLGTVSGNPLTYPFIVPASLKLGLGILGAGSAQVAMAIEHESAEHAGAGVWRAVKSWFGFGHGNPEANLGFFNDIFLPYLIGGTIIGLVFAAASYFFIRALVTAYQARRRVRLKERAKHRRNTGKAAQGGAKSV